MLCFAWRHHEPQWHKQWSPQDQTHQSINTTLPPTWEWNMVFLEDEFSLQRGHFLLPWLWEIAYPSIRTALLYVILAFVAAFFSNACRTLELDKPNLPTLWLSSLHLWFWGFWVFRLASHHPWLRSKNSPKDSNMVVIPWPNHQPIDLKSTTSVWSPERHGGKSQMPLEPGRGVTDSSLQVEIFHKRFHQPSSFADRFGHHGHWWYFDTTVTTQRSGGRASFKTSVAQSTCTTASTMQPPLSKLKLQKFGELQSPIINRHPSIITRCKWSSFLLVLSQWGPPHLGLHRRHSPKPCGLMRWWTMYDGMPGLSQQLHQECLPVNKKNEHPTREKGKSSTQKYLLERIC